jgi:hypothetical protein
MLNEKLEVKIITNANSVMSARTKADKRFAGEFYSSAMLLQIHLVGAFLFQIFFFHKVVPFFAKLIVGYIKCTFQVAIIFNKIDEIALSILR